MTALTADMNAGVFASLLLAVLLVVGGVVLAELHRQHRETTKAEAATAAAFAEQTATDLAFTTITAHLEEPTP